ncbi:hypothetical protein [Rhodocaloribacter sp.]
MEAKNLGPISPTVSKEKWAAHARSKLSRGYVLIVGQERRNANFHHPSKGYEMCPYKIARRLVDEGIVKPAGRTHHLGLVYVLASDTAPPPPPPSIPDDDDDPGTAPPIAELDDLLDRINVEDGEIDEDAEDEE